jgi:ketosteroid isomerase-like protein
MKPISNFFAPLSLAVLFTANNSLAQTPALVVVQQCYMDFGKGDIEGLVNALDNDVVWTDPGNVGPYAGARQGKAAVIDFFQNLGTYLNITQFETRDFFTLGNKVSVTGHIGGTAIATGAPFSSDWSMTWEVNDAGKVVSHHLYLDTDNIANAISFRSAQVGIDFLKAMDASDYEKLKACVSSDFKFFHPNFPQPINLDEYFEMQVTPFNKAFKNMTHTVVDSSCNGNTLSMRGVATGKHVGDLMGIAATGNDINVSWLAFAKLDTSGKIKEMHMQFNQLAFLGQLGINPMAKN